MTKTLYSESAHTAESVRADAADTHHRPTADFRTVY